MLLGKLRIRGKLTLLVMIPLLAMAGLVLPIVGNLVSTANRATEIDALATTAGRVGTLMQDLQSERLLSVGYLLNVVSEDDLDLQTALVSDRVRDIQRDLGEELSVETRAGIDSVDKLNPLRLRVRAKSVPPDRVLDLFAPVLDGLIESLRLGQDADTDTDAGRQLNALDALLRMDESNTESTAVLAIMSAGDVGGQVVRYNEEVAKLGTYFARFTSFATARERHLYDLVEAAFRERVGQNFDTDFELEPARTMAALPIAALFPALRSFSVLGGFVEKSLVDDVTSSVAQQRREQLAIAYGVGALVLLVLLAVLILVTAVARAVAVPLTQLSRAAELVADAGETELRRIADDDSESVEPVRLEVLDVNSRDEIGDLARVFERVQSTASQLVERQVLSRRNVAEMFGHIGRRTQNLVGGQVDLIDELENEETDPGRLAKLYRLDHIANRLRRSADSLVVISGADREQSHLAPVRLIDVARLALAEIEEYTRVDVDIPLDLLVAPAVVSDMVLICGELLENATNFSPPHTRVTLSAQAVPGGAYLVVADHGIGLPDERLVEENARLARRERLDLVPTQVLGLFVVGRLARRHQLTVALSHTPGGGVTVGVTIGSALLAGERIDASGALPVPVVEPLVEPAPIAVEWSQPRREIEQRPGTTETLSRVKDAMSVPFTWNAFEVDRHPPAALMVAPQPEPPAMMPPPPTSGRPPGGGDLRSLHRRVPGATLSPQDTTPRRPTGPPMIEHDPEQARSLVEEFESGVARALHETPPGNRQ